MGEKEPDPGKPSKEQRTESGLETGTPSVSEREAASGMATGREAMSGGDGGNGPLETSNLNLSKSNINRTVGDGTPGAHGSEGVNIEGTPKTPIP